VTGAFEASLGLGDPYHIGIAVNDLDDAIIQLGGSLGLEPWATLEAEIPAIYRGAETLTGIRSAFARSGPLLVELVQPTGGAFTAQTFLDERGEGIYHLGYWVEDMAGVLERAEAAGIGVDWRFPADGDPFAVYLDANQMLGIHVELVSPNMKPVIDQALKKAGA
jgi:catechol 2,3-dioxygenase-like lactoylglutathione lyase family enzyme